MEVQENADVSFQACKTVYLKPGFHAKSGSSFYAGITDENCSCGGKSGLMKNQNNNTNMKNIENVTHKVLKNEINNINSLKIKLYPNPGKEVVNLTVEDETAYGFEYKVFSTLGVLVEANHVDSNETQLFLKKGMYIIKVKYNGEWHTKKLIIQ